MVFRYRSGQRSRAEVLRPFSLIKVFHNFSVHHIFYQFCVQNHILVHCVFFQRIWTRNSNFLCKISSNIGSCQCSVKHPPRILTQNWLFFQIPRGMFLMYTGTFHKENCNSALRGIWKFGEKKGIWAQKFWAVAQKKTLAHTYRKLVSK